MNPGLTRPLKVGDKVWSKRFGYGKITQVNQEDLIKYPYVVQFNHRNETFSIEGIYQVPNPNAYFDLAGPLQEDGAIEPPNGPTVIVAKVKQVVNSENKKVEGTIIDIDGCKIFRSGDSMVILPQNDDL